jgi:hypothetical protein
MRTGWYVLGALISCAAPTMEVNQAPLSSSYTLLDQRGELRLLGVPQEINPDSDAPVVYDLFLQKDKDISLLSIAAIDAVLEERTNAIAWVSPTAELYLTSLSNKRDRFLDGRVFYGIVAQNGKLAYNIRVDGPESAVFLYDTQEQKAALLEDGVGADEILAFSPDSSQVLILSSRTGLSSLYIKDIKTRELEQLTNLGLKSPSKGSGPFDASLVAPNPTNKNEVVWGQRGIAYRSQEGTFLLTLDRTLIRLSQDASLSEAAQ